MSAIPARKKRHMDKRLACANALDDAYHLMLDVIDRGEQPPCRLIR